MKKVGHRTSEDAKASSLLLGLSLPTVRVGPVHRPHRTCERNPACTAHDSVDVTVGAFLRYLVASPPEILRMVGPADSRILSHLFTFQIGVVLGVASIPLAGQPMSRPGQRHLSPTAALWRHELDAGRFSAFTINVGQSVSRLGQSVSLWARNAKSRITVIRLHLVFWLLLLQNPFWGR